MKTPSLSAAHASPSSVARVAKSLIFAFAAMAALNVATPSLLAQNPPDAGGRRRGSDANGGDRGNFNPQEMQARMLNALRDRLEITDDEEWKLISERIAKLAELRRASGGPGGPGGFAGRGGPPGGGGGDPRGGGRGPRPGGNPEMELLSSALRDKLPDAEIKVRLERLREARKVNEAKLAKAQEDLRAVLSVRQEAVAVIFGLLP